MNEIIKILNLKYGIIAIPAKILGNRWEFSGISTHIPFTAPTKIQLNENEGIIIYSDKTINEELIKKIKTNNL